MADKLREKKAKKEEKKGCETSTKGPWEKPVLEDVSGKIMAQPYIRFT